MTCPRCKKRLKRYSDGAIAACGCPALPGAKEAAQAKLEDVHAQTRVCFKTARQQAGERRR